jgi:5'-nucleotidase
VQILVTNDDGVFSPGVQVLAQLAASHGDVLIVVPEAEQSSMGGAITASRPLSYRRTRIGAVDGFRVNGTPSDCVALGMHEWGGVDVVLSGINQGLNLGNGTWHSGALAAARQAALFGACGIAMSAPPAESIADYRPLAEAVTDVLKILCRTERRGTLFNVNFPSSPRGVRWTSQSVRHYEGRVVAARDPYGRPVYWFTAQPIEDVEPDTDRWAVREGFVSITPCRLDLSDEDALAEQQVLTNEWRDRSRADPT